MALVVADRVKETTTSTGTGAISLAGAEPNFRTFSSVLSDGDTTYYAIIDDTNTAFEVGLGTYASSGNTITRTTVLSSSNANSAVNFSAGSKDVLLTYPADKSAYLDGSNQLVINDAAVTSTAAELNLLDGATANTVVNSKAVIYGSGGEVAATSYTGDGSALTGIDAAPSFSATASGSIADGDPVILNTDGTVSKPTGQNFNVSDRVYFTSGTDRAQYCAVVFDPNANKSLIVYTATDSSNYLYGVVATVASDGAVTYGTPVAIDSTGSTIALGGTFDPDTNQCVFNYSRTSGTTGSYAVVCSISGTSFTFGTPVQYTSSTDGSSGNNKRGVCYDTTNDKVVIAYYDTNGQAVVGTVSGTSISFGTTTQFWAGSSLYVNSVFDTTNEKVVILWADSSSDARAVVGTVSGTSISFGTSVEPAGAGNTAYNMAVYDPDSGKILYGWSDTTADSGYFMIGTVSGTDITFTDPGGYFFETGNTTSAGTWPFYSRMAYDTNINKAVLFYFSKWDDTEKQAIEHLNLFAKVVTIDPVTAVPTFETARSVWDAPPYATINQNDGMTLPSQGWDVVFDSNVNKFLIASQDYVANGGRFKGIGFSVTINNSTLTKENFVGISNGAYADTATATIQLAGSVDDAQTGLTAGTGYYVGLDGSLIDDSTQTPSVFAGVATSATNLLIKG